jgi:hypothetical protein
MASSDNSAKGRRPMMFSCMSPPEHCNGRKSLEKNATFRGHSTFDQCRACTRAYLIKQGYKQLSTREFQPPPDPVTGETQPVLVLDKKPSRMKPGKVANGYMAQPQKVRCSAAAGNFEKQKALAAEQAAAA